MSSQLEAHVNGDCWPDNCVCCNSEPVESCGPCDGQGEVFDTTTGQIETCRTCLGTGVER